MSDLGKYYSNRLKQVIQPSTESLLKEARRQGAVEELNLIKRNWDKFDLGNTKGLIGHIEKRLKELNKL